MTNLQLINTNEFNGMSCDVYSDGSKIYMTRKQIGKALGYETPDVALSKIHDRHKDRLDQLSVVTKLVSTDGKMYDIILYSQRGIMEICRWSRQPLANAFMDWAWDIIEAYRDGTLAPNQSILQNDNLSIGTIQRMIDDSLAELRKELLTLPQMAQTAPQVEALSISTVQTPVDIIRKEVETLAKISGDITKGYNCTFRKIYAAMDVSWTHRATRYKNLHKNKNKPSKLTLVASDPKLTKQFLKIAEDMKESQNF